eukprot:3137506-Pyramimonas_sp.AAC.2
MPYLMASRRSWRLPARPWSSGGGKSIRAISCVLKRPLWRPTLQPAELLLIAPLPHPKWIQWWEWVDSWWCGKKEEEVELFELLTDVLQPVNALRGEGVPTYELQAMRITC